MAAQIFAAVMAGLSEHAKAKAAQPTKKELVAHYLGVELMRRNAEAVEVRGTVVAGQQRKEGVRYLSDIRAAMAGQGGSATDAGAVERAGEIGERTDYNVLAALYESRTKAYAMRIGADIKAWQKPKGPAAGATMLSAISSSFSAYTGAGGKVGGGK